jgi:bifunctional UDP-N-acetylglucosamine pyrophosphorylase/glucosamine-1-phosphate N-acetyltransferase
VRPGTNLSENTRIGNFVEVKNAKIGKSSKISHLSYVGDAKIGKNTNIGAGTIFCNFNGVTKNETNIGDDAFIGSNTSLIAPINIGSGAVVGSGSVISKNVPDDALAIERSKQKNKLGLAKKIMDKFRSLLDNKVSE